MYQLFSASHLKVKITVFPFYSGINKQKQHKTIPCSCIIGALYIEQPSLLNKIIEEYRAFVPFYMHFLFIHSSSTLSSNCSFFQTTCNCSSYLFPRHIPLPAASFKWLSPCLLALLVSAAFSGPWCSTRGGGASHHQCSDTVRHQRPKADWNDTCLGTAYLSTHRRGRSCLGDKRH